MQGIADVTGKTVETISYPTMAGALGAASCAFVGSGMFKDFHQINQCIKVRNTYHPDHSNSELYSQLFKSYKQVYSGLRKAYIRANLERFNT
jgi:sugar (pentulose or hexulose) kinase